MTYKEHRAKWNECSLCDYCSKRNKVVLCRGQIPCDVLFIGEAPGPSEDIIGAPFVGPAGKLLDQMIQDSMPEDSSLRVAFTNLVGCIPLDDHRTKFAEPSKESIKACRNRLDEFIELCKPSLIVRVGKLSKKYYTPSSDISVCDIVHPAAIIRADISQRGLMTQRAMITLSDSLTELV